MSIKLCTRCLNKPVAAKRSPYCKDCRKIVSREIGRKTHNGKIKDELLKKQNGCCAICDKPFIKSPNLDHDHKTGKVRGLLCHKCNTRLNGIERWLSKFDSDFGKLIEYFKRAHRYLERTNNA